MVGVLKQPQEDHTFIISKGEPIRFHSPLGAPHVPFRFGVGNMSLA